ncbi:MAG: type I methionyl aminopeptidase [Candidatus Dormibacteraceae bacterium]
MSRLRGRDACWCGSGRHFGDCHGNWAASQRTPQRPGHLSPLRPVPKSVARPSYAMGRRISSFAGPQIAIGGMRKRLRHAGRVAADVLVAVGAKVRPGITTDELDAIAHEAYVSRGAYPSTLNYRGYPKSICTSVNEVICHGIPDDHTLREGDIVSVDVTAFIDGVHGDTCGTFCVGEVDEPTRALVEGTRLAALAGIAAVAAGRPLDVIGQAVQGVADARGLGVVEDYGGHGIGAIFHAAPHVSHHRGAPGSAWPMPKDLVITVEPMLDAGTVRHHDWENGWTVVTDDLLPSAQFEHTVIVGEDGAEIMTLTRDGASAVGLPD